MNRNLFVYLHGMGFDKTENAEFTSKLASELNAAVLAFNAPFASGRSRGGYSWFYSNPETHEPIVDKHFYNSLDFVKSYIENTLKEKELAWDNVILSGRSQGPFFAQYMALSGMVKPSGIIALCTYDTNGFIANSMINTQIPIVWCHAKNETTVPLKHTNEYIKLQELGANLTRVILQDSNHDNLSLESAPLVALAARKMNII